MTPTNEKLCALIREAGAPLTLDQIMDMLPYADRKDVDRCLRELKSAGTLRSTVEDGKAAYDMADGVATIRPATKAAPSTNLERIRQLLADAGRPLNSGDIVSALPDINEAAVRKALSNGSYRRLWNSTRGEDGVHVWSLPGAGTVTAVAVATATANAAPATSPAENPAHLRQMHADQAAAKERGGSASLGSLLDHAVLCADNALRAYIASVGDVGIYDALHDAADAARAARAALGKTS